jgi:hypothetical protein
MNECSVKFYYRAKGWCYLLPGPALFVFFWRFFEESKMRTEFEKTLLISRPERLIKIISTRYFLEIKEINKYLVDMILINSFRSGS